MRSARFVQHNASVAKTAVLLVCIACACSQGQRSTAQSDAGGIADAAADAPREDAASGVAACYDNLNALNEAARQVTESYATCSTDSDCAVVDVERACYARCQVAVAAERVAEFESALEAAVTGICDARPAQCSPPMPLGGDCPVFAPRCDAGRCRGVCANEQTLATLADAGTIRRSGLTCGGVSCAPLPDSRDPRFDYASQCCTEANECGTTGLPYLNATCFPRDQLGTEAAECPDVNLTLYFDPGSNVLVMDSFPGCCTPDGLCGADTGGTLGAGCVERTALAAALADNCNADREQLAQELQAIACAP